MGIANWIGKWVQVSPFEGALRGIYYLRHKGMKRGNWRMVTREGRSAAYEGNRLTHAGGVGPADCHYCHKRCGI